MVSSTTPNAVKLLSCGLITATCWEKEHFVPGRTSYFTPFTSIFTFPDLYMIIFPTRPSGMSWRDAAALEFLGAAEDDVDEEEEDDDDWDEVGVAVLFDVV